MNRSFLAALAVASSSAFSAPAIAAEWTIAPYLWASDVSLAAKVNDMDLGGEVDFGDLLEKTDTAFMGHFEGRNERWGGFIDIIYLDVSDSRTTEIGLGGPILETVSVDANLTLSIYEAAALYRFNNAEPVKGSYELDLFAGVRTVQVDAPVSFSVQSGLPTPIEGSGVLDESKTDFLIGARMMGYFNQRWSWNIRGDYSAGGSEGIFNTHAMLGYTFGDGLFTLTGGYRFMDLPLEGDVDGSPTETDIELSGPLVGFVFNF